MSDTKRPPGIPVKDLNREGWEAIERDRIPYICLDHYVLVSWGRTCEELAANSRTITYDIFGEPGEDPRQPTLYPCSADLFARLYAQGRRWCYQFDANGIAVCTGTTRLPGDPIRRLQVNVIMDENELLSLMLALGHFEELCEQKRAEGNVELFETHWQLIQNIRSRIHASLVASAFAKGRGAETFSIAPIE
jgi:hypothetical protein